MYERTRGLLERELPVVRSAVRAGDHVADVGANHGLYTHVFVKRGATVDAFEPQQECVAVLHAYAARQRSGRVRVHPVALAATHGRGGLHLPRGAGSSPSASLRATGETGAPIDVELACLDSFELFALALLKIDVEGAELEVLRGGGETLRRSRPLLFVEVEQRHHRAPIADVFGEITSWGYDGAFLDGTGRLRPLSAFDLEQHQLEPAVRPHRRRPYINNFFFSPRGARGTSARKWPM